MRHLIKIQVLTDIVWIIIQHHNFLEKIIILLYCIYELTLH